MSHRVLVVDDEESIRALLTAYLEELGHHVVTAGDAAEGITAFEKHRPQLVIVDFLLPRGNGFTVVEAVRSREGGVRIPVIMMSGVFKNPKTAVEAQERYEVLDFLSKPLDLVYLGQLVHKALQGVEIDRDAVAAPIESPTPTSSPTPGPSSEGSRPPPRGLCYSPQSSEPANGVERSVPARPTGSSPERRYDVFVGRPFPNIPAEGELSELPLALLLSCLRFDEVTGMLDLTDRGTHRRIYFINGHAAFMQSNAEGENVGALLLRRGRITEPDFDRCLRYMQDEGRTLQRALLELRMVSESDLATAYKLLARQLLPLALGMDSGRFAWRETDAFVGRVPEGRFEPASVLFDGIKRYGHPPQMLRFFRGFEDVALRRTLQFDPLMPFFRRTFSAHNIASDIDGEHTYRTLTRKHSLRAMHCVPQVFALVTSGMAVLPEMCGPSQAGSAYRPAVADIDTSADLASEIDHPVQPDDLRARASIERFYREIMAQDFFQIFGVDVDGDVEVVRAKYFELAARWHQDAFADRSLGGARAKVDEIFSRITEAYETIADASKREDYLVYLDRRARGLPTDTGEIRRAGQLFAQAVAMIGRADWDGALPVLEEASKANPDPLYLATLGWVIFNLSPNTQDHVTDAVQLLKKAVQEEEDLPIAYQYLGQIAFQRGQIKEAHKWWKRCLECDPNNSDAARGLRLVQEGPNVTGAENTVIENPPDKD